MICLLRLIRRNMVSQRLQRLGFIRLRRSPSMRKGIDRGPPMKMGIRIWHQQPLHMLTSRIMASRTDRDLSIRRGGLLALAVGLFIIAEIPGRQFGAAAASVSRR